MIRPFGGEPVRLGIDFGTTRCVVAAAHDGRYPVATFDVDGTFVDYLPGLVARGPSGPVFGWEAAEVLATNPDAGLRSLKRVVTAARPDGAVPGFDASPLSLVTGFLERLKRAIIEESNLEVGEGEPLEAMVAVPANASTHQRYLTLEAFEAAGFVVVGLINEPTAGALDFAHRHLTGNLARSPKRYVVVYDLGGGTFDVSAVSLRERRFDLISTEGIGELGGDDFDALILDAALESLGLGADEVPAARRSALLERCREAKETLTPASRKVLVDLGDLLDDQDDQDPVVLQTRDLYARAEPLTARTLEVLERILDGLGAHGIDPEDPRQLGAVYLVGGAVAFPPVARALRARFSKKLKLAPQPHAATAVGLAIAADPLAKVRVREASTRCFGVWREAEDGRDKVFDPIIERHLAPPESGEPLVIERRYRPAHRVGLLRFVECTRIVDGSPAGDLLPWGEICFPYDPALAGADLGRDLAAERTSDLHGEVIEERYTYSADGRIAVSIRNLTHGYEREYMLDGTPG